MREIKFKIWVDNKWYDKCLVGNTNDTKNSKWTCPMVWLEDKKEWAHCDNGVICQYTGLHDKNGNEIYEGDIVRIADIEYETIDLAIIEFEGASFVLHMLTGEFKGEIMGADCWLQEEKEVIGNIYENPELLEVSQ